MTERGSKMGKMINELQETAAKKGYHRVLKALLKVHEERENMDSLLCLAASEGNLNVIRYLISEGVTVSDRAILCARATKHFGTAAFLNRMRLAKKAEAKAE